MGPDSQPLNMRFDSERDDQASAADILNTASEMELSEIFKRFGDEPFHSQLAANLVKARGRDPLLQTTGDFKRAIRAAFPQSAREETNQVVKRAF